MKNREMKLAADCQRTLPLPQTMEAQEPWGSVSSVAQAERMMKSQVLDYKVSRTGSEAVQRKEGWLSNAGRHQSAGRHLR